MMIKRRAGKSTLEITNAMALATNPVTKASYREILKNRIDYANETAKDSLERQELAELDACQLFSTTTS